MPEKTFEKIVVGLIVAAVAVGGGVISLLGAHVIVYLANSL